MSPRALSPFLLAASFAALAASGARGARAQSTNPYDEPESEDHAAAAASASAAPKPHVARVAVEEKDGMLHIPGGRLQLAPESKNAPTPPPVRVRPFWIDRTEVTVGAYRACVAKQACARPAKSSALCTYDANDPALPVSCVHWSDAATYCRAIGGRLPTELEWEFAAKGTTAMPYPWGGQPSCKNAATLVSNKSGRTCSGAHPDHVGAHPSGASVFGVFDLSGNVEEWTSDWYVDRLGGGPGPRVGASHTLRGGGWLTSPNAAKTTSRSWGSVLEAGPNVGFRCAKDG